jgi:multicomponent Na+:H+ antiporter subunit B
MSDKKRDPSEIEESRRVLPGLVLTLLFGVVLAAGMVTIPREQAPLPAIARQALDVALPHWKLTEPVNEVVYGTRGFDTFGETFLLLAAVISVIMLTRAREPRHGEEMGEERAGAREQAEDDPKVAEDADERAAREAERAEQEGGVAMTVVVRTAVRLVAPMLLVAGCYLVAWGYSPGGGFPAGAVLTGVVLLVYAAYGRKRVAKVVRPVLLEGLELLGAGVIIGTELLGLVLKGSFGANWLPLAPEQTIRSGGIVQVFSAAEFVEVGTGLCLVIFALLGARHDWTPDQ